MTRFVALRVFMTFMTLALLSAAIGLSSHVPLAEALFLVSAALGSVMLIFGLTTPVHAPVPVRVRRDRR